MNACAAVQPLLLDRAAGVLLPAAAGRGSTPTWPACAACRAEARRARGDPRPRPPAAARRRRAAAPSTGWPPASCGPRQAGRARAARLARGWPPALAVAAALLAALALPAFWRQAPRLGEAEARGGAPPRPRRPPGSRRIRTSSWPPPTRSGRRRSAGPIWGGGATDAATGERDAAARRRRGVVRAVPRRGVNRAEKEQTDEEARRRPRSRASPSRRRRSGAQAETAPPARGRGARPRPAGAGPQGPGAAATPGRRGRHGRRAIPGRARLALTLGLAEALEPRRDPGPQAPRRGRQLHAEAPAAACSSSSEAMKVLRTAATAEKPDAAAVDQAIAKLPGRPRPGASRRQGALHRGHQGPAAAEEGPRRALPRPLPRPDDGRGHEGPGGHGRGPGHAGPARPAAPAWARHGRPARHAPGPGDALPGAAWTTTRTTTSADGARRRAARPRALARRGPAGAYEASRSAAGQRGRHRRHHPLHLGAGRPRRSARPRPPACRAPRPRRPPGPAASSPAAGGSRLERLELLPGDAAEPIAQRLVEHGPGLEAEVGGGQQPRLRQRRVVEPDQRGRPGCW